MQRRLILYFAVVMISFLSVQKVNAQERKKLMNGNILTEIKNIQKRFTDSISHYDYQKNPGLYDEKYRHFYGEKLKELKSLYQNRFDHDEVIGKAGAASGVSSLAEIENGQQILDLQKRLTHEFPTYLLKNYSEETYRCQLNFIVDTDGKFKKVKYSGNSGTEFNIISALFLYAIGGLERPLLYKNTPIVQNFAQPVVVKFE